MSTVGIEFNQALRELGSDTASLLERVVREALALAQRGRQSASTDELRYPAGNFDATNDDAIARVTGLVVEDWTVASPSE